MLLIVSDCIAVLRILWIELSGLFAEDQRLGRILASDEDSQVRRESRDGKQPKLCAKYLVYSLRSAKMLTYVC